MVRKGWLVVLAALLLASTAPAQAAWQFQWKTGQVLTYRVEQTTTASEVLAGSKAESRTKLQLTKKWQVLGVDQGGVATVQMLLTAMRIEMTPPSGDPLLFDSANPDKSNEQLKAQLSRYLGVPLVVLRLDGRGQVVEVKESKYGPASKYENELPFTITLPGGDVAQGQIWQRDYQITLEPPQGTGEKYPAGQKYVCKAVAGTTATVAVGTTVKKLPEAIADQMPLLQLQPEGEVVFDAQAGRVQSVRLTIDKELKNHQGDGSSYRFQSNYSEQFSGSN